LISFLSSCFNIMDWGLMGGFWGWGGEQTEMGPDGKGEKREGLALRMLFSVCTVTLDVFG
jgi:hypothetical protein